MLYMTDDDYIYIKLHRMLYVVNLHMNMMCACKCAVVHKCTCIFLKAFLSFSVPVTIVMMYIISYNIYT